MREEQSLEDSFLSLWAKTSSDGNWHPLILHMLDVAASADAILSREPIETRYKIASTIGLPLEESKPWLLFLIACHDLGKACPGFQSKWPDAPNTGLKMPRIPNKKINHAFVSQICLNNFLQEKGWPINLAELVADAVGCHHGQRAKPTEISFLSGDQNALGNNQWLFARRKLMDSLLNVFKPSKFPPLSSLSGPDFMLLSGLTSFSDWIGSNEDFFSYGKKENCFDLNAWFTKRKDIAERALDGIGWNQRTPLIKEKTTFEKAFGLTPRPLQQAVSDILSKIKCPSLILIEAPMGEGKTEAAFFAYLELQRRFGHRGLYVALPTQATGNAMFERTLTFLESQSKGRTLDLQLLHGAALLNDRFQNLRIRGIHEDTRHGEVKAAEWFTHKKRALLSEYGVGTLDQALLPILPIRHNFVRIWGLANRVLVLDEIHAYDTYTGTLLLHLLRWLIKLDSSVILLSATLPPAIRRKLAEIVGAEPPQTESAYPRLSLFQQGSVEQMSFKPDPRRRLYIKVQGIGTDLPIVKAVFDERLPEWGNAIVLLNTVQRAQELYRLFPEGKPLERDGRRVGKLLSDGTEIFLFHARFPSECRQKREENCLEKFNGAALKEGRKLLIATQVAEQSLDLDFDLMITDLAPIDLVLQRAGRLWRHTRNERPIPDPILVISGLGEDKPPSFDKPLWWKYVYREDLLLRTWVLLHTRQEIKLPDEIDILVNAVYDEDVSIPDSILERMNQAMMDAEGNSYAYKLQADQNFIGFPDDASWNDSARFTFFDEDEPGVHRSIIARTRLGEDSINAIPIWSEEKISPVETPDYDQAKALFQRTVNLSRKNIVSILHNKGVPDGWKQSPLLRNCYPLNLDTRSHWIEDDDVRWDEELGIIYDQTEVE